MYATKTKKTENYISYVHREILLEWYRLWHHCLMQQDGPRPWQVVGMATGVRCACTCVLSAHNLIFMCTDNVFVKKKKKNPRWMKIRCGYTCMVRILHGCSVSSHFTHINEEKTDFIALRVQKMEEKWIKRVQIVCRAAPNPSRYEGVNVLVEGFAWGEGTPAHHRLTECGWRGLLLSSKPHSIIIITRFTATASYASSSSSSSSSPPPTPPSPGWREKGSHRRNKRWAWIAKKWALDVVLYVFFFPCMMRKRRWACFQSVCFTQQLGSILWIGPII